jgi:glycosyltransferase involved in cell wall biosynthesis
MRVLNVVGGFGIGGTERYLARIAPLLRHHGIELDFCALELEGPLLGEYRAAGVKLSSTPYIDRARGSNTLALARTVDTIRRLVRVNHYPIVHTYLFWSDVLGVTAARLAGCPRVIESRRALHPWRHGPGRFLHALELGTNLLAHEMIANSYSVLRDVLNTERCVPARRTVIYNGIDVDLYGQAAPGSTSGPLRIVTVGALAQRKGQQYAIEAMHLLGQAGVDVHLTLVGAGPDEAMLRRLVAGYGLDRRVTFAGEQPDPRPYLEAADLFLLASRQEGFSNALLEAMASGLPVVCTDVGGNSEALVEGEGGCIVPPRRPEALAAAAAELAARRADLAGIGRANRSRAEDRFSLAASLARLAAWYRAG